MDEPLSNLDAKLRVQVRAEIARLQNDLGVTTIYVTHDQVEAMTMGDRVAVMRKGVLQQVASPQELYDHPVNLFVGGFIGSPSMNLFEATLERADGGLTAVAGGQRLAIPDEVVAERDGLRAYEGKTVIVGIRPESLEDASMVDDPPENSRLRGRVELTEALGSELMAHFTIEARPAVTEHVKELAEDVGETLSDESANETEIVARFDPRSQAREGQPIEAVVDTRSLHFFDAETGAGIYANEGKRAQA
jgi:multiple sugar transport system ATP-binding protein